MMDENLRQLLFSFYALGVNDTDLRRGEATHIEDVQANFDSHLSQNNWNGVRIVRVV